MEVWWTPGLSDPIDKDKVVESFKAAVANKDSQDKFESKFVT